MSMSLSMASLLFLLVVNLFIAREVYRLRAKGIQRAIGDVSEDDQLLAAIEVHALTSPLAKRLLLAAHDAPTLPVVVDDWRHDTKIQVPPAEHWGLFLRDLALELDDLGRAACLDRWLEGGTTFTCHERAETVALFVSAEWRDAARASFNHWQSKRAAK